MPWTAPPPPPQIENINVRKSICIIAKSTILFLFDKFTIHTQLVVVNCLDLHFSHLMHYV